VYNPDKMSDEAEVVSPSNIAQEQKGLAKVILICAAMNAIWRPTPNHDLGIDGQIEFMLAAQPISTGNIVAVQVKSGPSYFEHEEALHIKYYPAAKHRRYWTLINLPVILILHDPDRDLTIYTSVKQQLFNKGPLLLRKDTVFSAHARDKLQAICREDVNLVSPATILDGFQAIKYQVNNERLISGIEFLLACASPIGEYLEIRMCRIVTLVELATGDSPLRIGEDTREFVHRCSTRCMFGKLTDPFLHEFESAWYDNKMVPDITVPMTSFGKMVIDYLYKNLDKYLSPATFSVSGKYDPLKIATVIFTIAQAESEMLDMER
jgi:hypothetical protein